MDNNGLKLQSIKSKREILDRVGNFENLLSQKITTKSFVVAYLDNEVLIGTYKNSQFNFYNGKAIDPKFIQRLRVFNKEKELLIWRSSDGLKGRIRDDTEGDDIDAVDAHQALYGTKVIKEESLDGFTKITEDRGTELILPFSILDVDDKKKRVFVKTRNYIAYNGVYQASYVDCRFMGFSFWNEKTQKIEEIKYA